MGVGDRGHRAAQPLVTGCLALRLQLQQGVSRELQARFLFGAEFRYVGEPQRLAWIANSS